jgi:hypothetical protein
VVHDEIDDDPKPERLRVVHEFHEIARRAVLGMDPVEVADIVSVVAVRRRIERLQPETCHAETREVFEAAVESLEVTCAIPIRIHVLFNVQAVENRVLVPEVVDGHATHRRCGTGRIVWVASRRWYAPASSAWRRSLGVALLMAASKNARNNRAIPSMQQLDSAFRAWLSS